MASAILHPYSICRSYNFSVGHVGECKWTVIGLCLLLCLWSRPKIFTQCYSLVQFQFKIWFACIRIRFDKKWKEKNDALPLYVNEEIIAQYLSPKSANYETSNSVTNYVGVEVYLHISYWINKNKIKLKHDTVIICRVIIPRVWRPGTESLRSTLNGRNPVNTLHTHCSMCCKSSFFSGDLFEKTSFLPRQ